MTSLKFVTDGMLGKLTRWLRMLGHDVEYAGSMDDKLLISKAKEEDRILLTRDVDLYRRAVAKGVETFLIESPNQTASLAGLAKRFGFDLRINMAISRCPKCNGTLEHAAKATIADKLFDTTALNYDDFWQCQACGQVYWQGTHWSKIEKTLEQARQSLET